MADLRSREPAILARDAAATRLRRLTAAVLAASAGIAGLLAGVAASSGHGGTVLRGALPAKRAASVPEPAATVPFPGAPQAGTATPASAPVPSVGQPVVVSGGS